MHVGVCVCVRVHVRVEAACKECKIRGRGEKKV